MSNTPFLDDTVRAFCVDVVEAAQRNIGAVRLIKGKRRRRVSSGALKESLMYYLASNNYKYAIDFTSSDATRAYADVIEKGRRPGARMPPPSAILAWMNQKNIRLQKKGGGFIKETPALRQAAAFMIARSIGKKGIEGIHYYQDAIDTVSEQYADKFREAMTKDLEIRISLK